MNIFQAFILGMVEGITEFLPISSTGHLILTSKLLSINQDEFTKSFEIIIQMGAILSVVFIYFKKLISDLRLIKVLFIAFLPSAILGFLFSDYIKNYFFNYIVVSIMLVFWGTVFILVEKLNEKRKSFRSYLDYRTAFLVGVFQCFSLIPGTSRSGATIIGGMILGLDRKTATEFSFLLSVPTIVIASIYEFTKESQFLLNSNFSVLIVGFITSFVFAYLSVKWLINFVSHHTFIAFGIYRILLGLIFLVFA
ncbi:MAG: undecaprenyl-diphosphate phosphatase [candidate division WOR-3 bacterium]|nr:undecaprenyl-diphosphate phosphatase [candidate division WOR-3 bacterium]MDW8150422.1 undecaprenyl-diphosphate phosphatase [candidate division WOR-3 bacterium]